MATGIDFWNIGWMREWRIIHYRRNTEELMQSYRVRKWW